VVKRFHRYVVFDIYYSLAYGFGLIQQRTSMDDPCYPLYDTIFWDLVYTRINGREFGTLDNVGEVHKEGPATFSLVQNYPNPFNPSTTISFSIPRSTYTTLTIYNTLGQEIATLVSDNLNPGTYSKPWNATNVASGVYFYKLTAGESVQTKKLILMK
jgi:hypothetical protein